MHGNDIGGTAVVSLVSALIGLSGYLLQGTAVEALLIAASCGLVGGVFKGVGAWLWHRGIGWWRERKRPKQ